MDCTFYFVLTGGIKHKWKTFWWVYKVHVWLVWITCDKYDPTNRYSYGFSFSCFYSFRNTPTQSLFPERSFFDLIKKERKRQSKESKRMGESKKRHTSFLHLIIPIHAQSRMLVYESPLWFSYSSRMEIMLFYHVVFTIPQDGGIK